MNTRDLLSLLSGLAYAGSAAFYVIHVAKAKIKPNIGSFLIWSFMNTSLLVSLLAAHVWNSVPFAAVATIHTITVCFLSLKRRKFYFSKVDLIAAVLGVSGVALWLLTRQAEWNIYIVNLVNAIVFVPLLAKTIKFPHYETPQPWYANLLGATLLLLSTPYLSLVYLVTPLTQFVCSVSINSVLYRKRPLDKK